MSYMPQPNEIYKHFKGNLYRIIAVAEHSETGEPLVIYQALEGDLKVYARPLTMFTSRVDKQKYPRAMQEYRFELQETECQCVESVETDAAALEAEAEALNIDPLVLEFLDSDDYEHRLNILACLQHRITNEMITTMAIACDLEVEEGSTQERYEALRNCLLTLEKYECNRLR